MDIGFLAGIIPSGPDQSPHAGSMSYGFTPGHVDHGSTVDSTLVFYRKRYLTHIKSPDVFV